MICIERPASFDVTKYTPMPTWLRLPLEVGGRSGSRLAANLSAALALSDRAHWLATKYFVSVEAAGHLHLCRLVTTRTLASADGPRSVPETLPREGRLRLQAYDRKSSKRKMSQSTPCHCHLHLDDFDSKGAVRARNAAENINHNLAMIAGRALRSSPLVRYRRRPVPRNPREES